MIIAVNSNVKEINEHKVALLVVLLGFSFIGLILKCVYCRYLHIWAWLIMDYITLKEDGHWKCILLSNMFLCGDIRERKLLLCCLPRPFFKFLNFFFGERKFHSTGSSCSLCSAFVSVLLFPVAVALA